MTPRSLPARLLVSSAALALIAACSSSGGATAAPPTTSSPPTAAAPAAPPSTAAALPPSAQPPAAETQAATVTIKGFEYQVPKSVPAGGDITVVNEDSEAHTLTLGRDADVQVVVQGGKTVTITAPSKAGSYPIVCDFHGNMTSELVVA